MAKPVFNTHLPWRHCGNGILLAKVDTADNFGEIGGSISASDCLCSFFLCVMDWCFSHTNCLQISISKNLPTKDTLKIH